MKDLETMTKSEMIAEYNERSGKAPIKDWKQAKRVLIERIKTLRPVSEAVDVEAAAEVFNEVKTTPEEVSEVKATPAKAEAAKEKNVKKSKVVGGKKATAKVVKKAAKVVKKAAAKVDAKGKRTHTIAILVLNLLKQGLEPKAVVKAVQKEFPKARTTESGVVWYIWRYTRDGLL